MALWELNEFQGPQFLGFVRNVPTPEPFTADLYLPNRTVFDIQVEYQKGVTDMTPMAHVMAWDSETPIGSKPGLGSKVQLELPPIKRKERISEQEIIRFLTPRAATPDIQNAIDSVYDVTRRQLDSVQARVEWMRMQALSEATLAYNEDGLQFIFDYGFDANLQVDQDVTVGLGDNWDTVATADPIADLQFIRDLYFDTTGFDLEKIVISKKVIPFLLRNDAARDLIRGTGAASAQLAQAEIDTLFSLYGLPRLETYDAQVWHEDLAGVKTQIRPLDYHKGFGLPLFGIGETLWGPTAESRGLYGTVLAQEAPGIWASTYASEDPPTEWVKAVGVAIPKLDSAEFILQWDNILSGAV